MTLEDDRPRVEDFRRELIAALREANDIDDQGLSLDELVARASAQFSTPKKVDWDEVNWTDGCWQGCASFRSWRSRG